MHDFGQNLENFTCVKNKKIHLHQYRFFRLHTGHKMFLCLLKFTVIFEHEGVFIMDFGQPLRTSRSGEFERKIKLCAKIYIKNVSIFVFFQYIFRFWGEWVSIGISMWCVCCLFYNFFILIWAKHLLVLKLSVFIYKFTYIHIYIYIFLCLCAIFLAER